MFRFASRHPVKASKGADELQGRHPVVHLFMLGDKADVGVGGGVLPRVHAEEFDLPCAGPEFAHEEFEQRRFARTVHAEDPRNTPLKPKVMLLKAWMRP